MIIRFSSLSFPPPWQITLAPAVDPRLVTMYHMVGCDRIEQASKTVILGELCVREGLTGRAGAGKRFETGCLGELH